MAETYDLILRGGRVATPNGLEDINIAVKDGRIAAIGERYGRTAGAR